MSPSSRGEKTRQRILAYASRIFYERGIRKITVEELCVGIGISKRTFYKYFANRDELVETLVIERITTFGTLIIENLNSDKAVDDILKTHFHLLLNNMFSQVSTQMMADIQLLLPHIWDQIEYFRHGLMEIMAKVLMRGQKDGSINKNIEPEVVGKILQSLVLHLANPQFLLANGLSIEQLVTNWQNIMLYGVLSSQGRS